jgi:hypothetical protein
LLVGMSSEFDHEEVLILYFNIYTFDQW